MKNNLIFQLKSKIKINIQGKNIERFIKRLTTNKIELLKIEYLKYNEINILIYKKDYEKVLELKSIYEVSQKDIYGIIKIRKVLFGYRFFLIFFVIGIALLFFLSNLIFHVEVVHTDSKVRNFLLTELEERGIFKYQFKKSFQQIQEIKNDILEEYKDTLEWLEIEEKGTTYIVRVQTRIIPNLEQNTTKQHIVAKKDAILKRIVADSGEVVKEINDYVNKGDIVISGNIHLYEEIKDTIRAEGKIYGEVWYNVSIEYPYIYSEIKETGNQKEVYVLKLFDKTIEFTKHPYLEKHSEEEKILWHSFLPISFVKQRQKEIQTISLVLTEEEATLKAIEKAKEKMLSSLDEDAEIIDYQILNSNIKEDRIVLNVFFTVCENITDYQAIQEVENVP